MNPPRIGTTPDPRYWHWRDFMFEMIRKVMFIGMGAAAMSWDKMRETLDDLVSRGDLTAEEGQKLYSEMTQKAEEQGREASQRINTQVRKTLADLGVANGDRIANLERRIEVLEQRIRETSENTAPDVDKS